MKISIDQMRVINDILNYADNSMMEGINNKFDNFIKYIKENQQSNREW